MERDQREESSSSSSSSSGINPWSLLVLLSIFILLFLPSFLSAPYRGFRPTAVKSGWDTLNFVLVLFAILCGVVGRWTSGDDVDRSAFAASSSAGQWYPGFSDSTTADHAVGIRRMRNSSSYPDLRQEALWDGTAVSEGWRFYDDIDLYRRRPESRGLERQGSGDRAAVKTIPADTFVLPRSPSPKPISPPREPPPAVTRRLPRRRSMERLQENVLDKYEISEGPGKLQAPEPMPAEVQPVHRLRRGRSLEKLPPREAERDSNRGTRHRRRRSLEDLSNWQVEQDWILELQKNHAPPPAPPAHPPPPPPPPPFPKEKRSQKGTVGGAKDIAAAIALFYQKKKKGMKAKRSNSDASHHFAGYAAPPPPPPPPPPPSSIFRNLFSSKKSKSRRIHSVSVAPMPPPPPPPLYSARRLAKKEASRPPLGQPPPPTIRQAKEDFPVASLRTPPAPGQGSLYSSRKSSVISDYPRPPRSPLLPPPLPPPPEAETDEEAAENANAGKIRAEEGATPAFWPSPDVNNKADLFIARFRAGLELEKQNSAREKQQQQQQRGEEEEFMVIGSLFDDDLCATSEEATATADTCYRA